MEKASPPNVQALFRPEVQIVPRSLGTRTCPVIAWVFGGFEGEHRVHSPPQPLRLQGGREEGGQLFW